MTETILVSSLEKCFPDQMIADFHALTHLSVMKNERFSVQLLARASGEDAPHRAFLKLDVVGSPCAFSVRTVECLPSLMPCYPGKYDDNYLRTEKGLYPDLLLPLGNVNRVPVVRDEARAYFITFEPDGEVSGDFTLTFTLADESGGINAKEELSLEIIDASLPEQEIKVTQWFHGDCVAQYHCCEVFSRRWWSLTENYIKTAVRNGINTILTPVFTPPLDTAPGNERLTVQLVGVETDGLGNYTFDFKNLAKWIKMCDRCGVKFLEISHLFTQWGAAHAPKVMATLNGEYRRIFGWETEADGIEYSHFLRTFIAEFKKYMKSRGDLDRCLFHISDEPNIKVIEQYKRSRAVVADLLADCNVIDALSNMEFYESGLIKTPVPANNRIKPFLDAKVEGLWTYYCCSQSVGVSNRFFAMPSCRTRCIGAQFFKYDIAGFLQWGYNFYNSQFSLSQVNPYLDTTGNYFVPSGDAFSVYPAPDGAYESLRLVVFHEALEDLSAFSLCASLIGKDETVKVIEDLIGEISFDRCAHSPEEVLSVREKINYIIKSNLKK